MRRPARVVERAHAGVAVTTLVYVWAPPDGPLDRDEQECTAREPGARVVYHTGARRISHSGITIMVCGLCGRSIKLDACAGVVDAGEA
jgi:hypothetical protein